MLRPLIPLALATAATASAARETLPFPLTDLRFGASPEVLEFELDAGLLAGLTDLSAVRLTDVHLPAGGQVALDLERIDFDARDFGAHVNGAPAPFDPRDMTLWKGGVVGRPGSHAYLALSSHGTYGWIHDGAELTHVSSFPGDGGDWSRARGRMFTDAALVTVGPASGPPPCASDRLVGPGTGPSLDAVLNPPPPTARGNQTLELKMAIETDWQLYQNWNDLQATETYVFALLGALSDRLESQANIHVTFPYVQFWTTSADPWTSQDSGGSCGDLLTEFRDAWAGNVPNGAHLSHFLSGASLGCGVAWVDVICNSSYGFAMSCCINGGVNFPVTQGSNTWDFFVFAHESGHNLGSPHTHDYCPPLDECASNCNGTTQCTNQGTNMSYCHGCSGGMNNITTYYHPTVVGVIRNAAESSCIPDYDPPTTQIYYDDFEVGGLRANGWTKRNARRRPNAAHEGNRGAKIRKSGKIERTVDTTGYSDIVVRYWRRTKNYEPDEFCRFRYSTDGGNSWTTAEEVQPLSWGFVEFEMPPAADDNPNFMLRFKSFKGDEGRENTRIDQVEVLGK